MDTSIIFSMTVAKAIYLVPWPVASRCVNNVSTGA